MHIAKLCVDNQNYSMDSLDIHRIKHAANIDVVRRLLIKYFSDKGFTESFDRQLYPSVMQDLPFVVPSLTNKVEIVPHAVEIDPTQGKAILGWNMFVLGSHRMYLGETHHNNLNDLARQINSGLITIPEGFNVAATARRQTTPKKVVAFITRVLSNHESGYVNLMPSQMPFRQPGDTYAAKQTLSGMPQQFFTRSGY